MLGLGHQRIDGGGLDHSWGVQLPFHTHDHEQVLRVLPLQSHEVHLVVGARERELLLDVDGLVITTLLTARAGDFESYELLLRGAIGH